MLPDSEIESLLNSLSDPEDLDTSAENCEVVINDKLSVFECKACYEFKIGIFVFDYIIFYSYSIKLLF